MTEENETNPKYRTCLPAKQSSSADFSLWTVLKQGIGKELSKIAMPVVFNEPLSFLQRVTEYLEYSAILDSASKEDDPVRRMESVMAFAVSGLASNWERLGKPFNPLLGETYELARDGYRIVAEQVSHHPPVSAFHAEADQWLFHGSIHPRLKFWGKSVEIQPKGTLTLELLSHGEAYTWSNVNCCVHNLISGQLWIEQYGTMEIINHVTGHKGVLTFKTGTGKNAKDLHKIEGYVEDKEKVKLSYMYGRWTDLLKATDFASYEEYKNTNPSKFRKEDCLSNSSGSSKSSSSKKMFSKFNSITSSFRMSVDQEALDDTEESYPNPEDLEDSHEIPRSNSTYSLDIPNSRTLWAVTPRPDNSEQFYHFTSYAMSLNEKENVDMTAVPPTDSRLRPDIRLLEEGDMDAAASEKTRLEEKQRETRKKRKKSKDEWSSRWFDQGNNIYTQQSDWLFTGSYWLRKFNDIETIF